jgi:D-3-phosphoglycerate dehydrogenase
MKNERQVILTDDGSLETAWPFTRERFEQRLKGVATVTYLDIRKTSLTDLDWKNIDAIALFGGELTEDIIQQANRLKIVGGMTDGQGPSSFDLLSEKDIPFIDATAAWGQSVAECGFGLILSALRKLPHWHKRLADGNFDWKYPYEQFCDDPNFINGELGTKTIGVVGMGQIGSRIATWCHHFGATVFAYDPYAPDERFEKSGAIKQDIDTLVGNVEILIIAVPPTPSAQNLVDAKRVMKLSKGSIVMTITRTAAIDVKALRERVLANEILWASDVYDVEPLPANDPILGRDNVVHVPHIAGRTKDANIRLADIIADDFIRVFKGEIPTAALTQKAVRIRTGNG